MAGPEQPDEPLWKRVQSTAAGYFIHDESKEEKEESKQVSPRRIKSVQSKKVLRRGSLVNILHPLTQQKPLESDDSTLQVEHLAQSYGSSQPAELGLRKAQSTESESSPLLEDGDSKKEKIMGQKKAKDKLLGVGFTLRDIDVESQMVEQDVPFLQVIDQGKSVRKTPRSMQNESTPLLRTFTAETILHEDEAEIARAQFNYPTAFNLVSSQAAGTLAYMGYTGTSWLFCCFQREHLSPDCNIMWHDNYFLRAACQGSFLMFWTFPLFCCMVLLMLSYRDLLHTRIWYECLAHRVLLDFQNIHFYESPSMQVMMGYTVLTLPFYYFSDHVEIGAFLGTLPYWIPIASFSFILISQWDLETRLLSLAKFIEFDPSWSFNHVNRCFFLRDFVAKQAYFNVCKGKEIDNIITTGSLIRAVTQEASSMWDRDDELEETDSYNTDIHHCLQNDYWVTNFLWNRHLQDARATKFRNYFRGYAAYTGFMFILLIYLYISTIVSHLYSQHVLSSSFLTHWFSVDALQSHRLPPMSWRHGMTGK